MPTKDTSLGIMHIDPLREFVFSVQVDKLAVNKIVFNPPATIVLWRDGTKTVVKCGENEEFDYEVGVAMCFMKKHFGSRSAFKKLVKKYKPVEKEEEPMTLGEMNESVTELIGQIHKAFYGVRRPACLKK